MDSVIVPEVLLLTNLSNVKEEPLICCDEEPKKRTVLKPGTNVLLLIKLPPTFKVPPPPKNWSRPSFSMFRETVKDLPLEICKVSPTKSGSITRAAQEAFAFDTETLIGFPPPVLSMITLSDDAGTPDGDQIDASDQSPEEIARLSVAYIFDKEKTRRTIKSEINRFIGFFF